MAASLLPQHDGFLPYFLLFGSISALAHSAVCYLSPSPDRSLVAFSGPAAAQSRSALLARVYGVKNVYTALIRLYAAYHITNPQVYDLAVLTWAGVLWLYTTEVFAYGTVRLREAAWPFVMASTGLAWMVSVRKWYVRA